LAKIFVPGSVGNVGPGFDVLGLELAEIGDTFSGELHDGPPTLANVSGVSADKIPADPQTNCSLIAAQHFLRQVGSNKNILLSIDRCLPLAGGMGSSASASIGGALLAAELSGHYHETKMILEAALVGETAVAGAHLDNIAPSLYGGLCLILANKEVVELPIKGEWWLSLITPDVEMPTLESRNSLPKAWDQWIPQMANTAGLVAAFAQGDHELARKSLEDLYAEPIRSQQIPNFSVIKQAAIDSGALACTISGGGPSIFALSSDKPTAQQVLESMQNHANGIRCSYMGLVTKKGAHLQ
jgi:homoserine kinase